MFPCAIIAKRGSGVSTQPTRSAHKQTQARLRCKRLFAQVRSFRYDTGGLFIFPPHGFYTWRYVRTMASWTTPRGPSASPNKSPRHDSRKHAPIILCAHGGVRR